VPVVSGELGEQQVGTAFTTMLGEIEAELLPPSVTEIAVLKVPDALNVPLIVQVVPVTLLQPLAPAGRPLDVQVSVPLPQSTAVNVTPLSTCVLV
jgi:hypothetical protein